MTQPLDLRVNTAKILARRIVIVCDDEFKDLDSEQS